MLARIRLREQILSPLFITDCDFGHLTEDMLVVVLKTSPFLAQLGIENFSEFFFELDNSFLAI